MAGLEGDVEAEPLQWERGQPHYRAATIGRAAHRKGEERERDRGVMRPALPVAHLAGMEAANILRAERAGEQARGHEQSEQPGFLKTGHARSFMHAGIGMGGRGCKEAEREGSAVVTRESG